MPHSSSILALCMRDILAWHLLCVLQLRDCVLTAWLTVLCSCMDVGLFALSDCVQSVTVCNVWLCALCTKCGTCWQCALHDCVETMRDCVLCALHDCVDSMCDCGQCALHDCMKWLCTVCIAWLCTHCVTVSIVWMYGINAWLGALQYSVYCLKVCTAWLCNFLHCAPRYCVHRLIAYSVNVSSKLILH